MLKFLVALILFLPPSVKNHLAPSLSKEQVLMKHLSPFLCEVPLIPSQEPSPLPSKATSRKNYLLLAGMEPAAHTPLIP